MVALFFIYNFAGMIIAENKRKENIAEYLLYMWQIEDIIRANNLDIEKIQETIIDRFDEDESVKGKIREWYEGLIEMMLTENIRENGHLQLTRNVILNLTELHNGLLNNPQESAYISNYYKTLPFIVELRSKSGDVDMSEIETCFSALYGFLLLRVQHKDISGETQSAISQISTLLRLLTEKYHKQQRTENI